MLALLGALASMAATSGMQYAVDMRERGAIDPDDMPCVCARTYENDARLLRTCAPHLRLVNDPGSWTLLSNSTLSKREKRARRKRKCVSRHGGNANTNTERGLP